jgi:hypothetical protein
MVTEKVHRAPWRLRMLRLSSLTLATTALLALPAASRASDPLLSGYGGPGGGQQVLLGSHLLGGAGGSGGGASGSLRAPASLRASGSAPGGGSSSGSTASGRPARSGTGARTGARTGAAHGAHGGTAAAAGAPRALAYPRRADDAGGFPLSAGEVLAGLLALVAAGGMGAWLRRTATRVGGGGAQAAP